jgi:phosphoglycerate dehydrogenase-like enzyme
MNTKLTYIATARGIRSFSSAHVRALQKIPQLKFVSVPSPLSVTAFHRLFNNAHIIALTPRTVGQLTIEHLAPLKKLQGIAVFATGVDWIDTDYIADRKIVFKRLLGYATDTVAEHTLGMVLTMTHRLHLSWDRARGHLPHSISIRGTELKGKRVGLLGYGRIGRAIEKRLRPFASLLKIRDRVPSQKGLDEWIRPLDVLILALSRSFGSPPIIGEKELRAAKSTLLLINPSRAALVDNQAVIASLKRHRLGGYAVDDTVPELLDRAIEPGRILQTAHTGWYSTEALGRGLDAWVKNILELSGRLRG